MYVRGMFANVYGSRVVNRQSFGKVLCQDPFRFHGKRAANRSKQKANPCSVFQF